MADVRHLRPAPTHLLSTDGQRLYQESWLPKGAPARVLVLLHGYAEHLGRYAAIARRFVAKGTAVYLYDQRGHGRSTGRRAYVERFEPLVEDLAAFLVRVRHHRPGVPLFLMGHSMGGAVATLYHLLQAGRPADGLILSSAALAVPDDLAPVLRPFARLASRLAPRLPTVQLDPHALCSDPAVVQAFLDDPLTFTGRMPARTGAEILRATRQIGRHMEDLTVPLLILQGTADRIVAPAGSIALHERAAARDKTLKLYQNARHETFREPNGGRVLEDIQAWITRRTSAESTTAEEAAAEKSDGRNA